MRTSKWRQWFLDRKLISEERLPVELYPPYTCVPKWYTLRKIANTEAKARKLEIFQAFAMRKGRVRKAEDYLEHGESIDIPLSLRASLTSNMSVRNGMIRCTMILCPSSGGLDLTDSED